MSLSVRSRQKSYLIDPWLVRRIAKWVLDITEPNAVDKVKLCEHELSVFIIGLEEMSRLNFSSLRHEGATDVISFDYSDYGKAPKCGPILGDLYICPAVAEENAKDFGATFAQEITRYLIHGILHLRGYDDKNKASRKIMEQEENRLMNEALSCFPLSSLVKEPKTKRG